jgi:hypothetical protein
VRRKYLKIHLSAQASHAVKGRRGWVLEGLVQERPSGDSRGSKDKGEDAYLPDDNRLNIVSGIDLTQSVEAVKAQLKEKSSGLGIGGFGSRETIRRFQRLQR